MSKSALEEKSIIKNWRKYDFAKKLEGVFGKDITLERNDMKCFKNSFKSSIWKLKITTTKQSYYIILKIFKIQDRTESIVELNMYSKAQKILPEFMPEIYWIEHGVNDNEVWVLMENMQQLEGQIVFTPNHFDKLIPTLAKLHAHTHDFRFTQVERVFSGWLPLYHSSSMMERRNEINELTKSYLDKAMKRPDLKEILAPSYTLLHNILKKGPNYFPELLEAGQSIVHSDLQTTNIGCNNVEEQNWDIKFIDWEGARFDPCWFDMVSLVGVFLSYRDDWRKDETNIVRRCARLYAEEMGKYGVVFRVDPVKLYNMAVLQLILEKNLYHQLSWEVEGIKKGYLLKGYIEKINVLGKELGLY